MIHVIIPRMSKDRKPVSKKVVQASSITEADVPKEPVNLRLDPADIKALDVIAKKNGISRTAVISIACKRIIETGI